MRWFRISLIFAVAGLALLLSPTGGSHATPGVGGTPIFSVSTIGGAWDVSPAPVAFGMTCTSADVLTMSGAGPAGACAPRLGPAPPGPVPDAVTAATIDAGLNLVAGPFTDDLDGLSFREAVGAVPVADYDFSVDPAPPNGGTTVGIPCGPPPNVNSEATAGGGPEAQGDIFTTAGAPAGCNVQFMDEGAMGLIAPNPGAPGMPPLDNVDALAEFPFIGGPCTAVGGTFLTICAAFTVTAGSAVLGAIPPSAPCGGLPADGATILVPPGAPPTVCTPAGCPPGGIPCVALPAMFLGLAPAGEDIDALCWFDVNANMLPDLPLTMFPGGDMYMFSLAPGSASVVGGPMFSPADILGTRVPMLGVPTVIRTAASLGLMPADNVDGLMCHQLDVDADTIPGDLDNCPSASNATQTDGDSDTVGDVCDNCPSNANANQANSDGDQWGDVCDNCPTYSTPWMVPPGDTDCDAFTDGDEGTIGTDAADPCPDNAADDAWPADFDMSKVVNISDVFFLLPPTFGTAVPPTSARRDLVPDNVINISDVFKVLPPVFGSSCT